MNRHTFYVLGVNDSDDADRPEIAAFAPASGKVLWRYASGKDGAMPQVFADTVVAVAGGRATGLDARTGRPVWTIDGAEDAYVRDFPRTLAEGESARMSDSSYMEPSRATPGRLLCPVEGGFKIYPY